MPTYKQTNPIFKWAIPGHFFIYFRSSTKKNYNFSNKSMWKMSIQYMVLGFEPTTSWKRVYSHNHLTRVSKLILLISTLIACFLPLKINQCTSINYCNWLSWSWSKLVNDFSLFFFSLTRGQKWSSMSIVVKTSQSSYEGTSTSQQKMTTAGLLQPPTRKNQHCYTKVVKASQQIQSTLHNWTRRCPAYNRLPRANGFSGADTFF